jgi:hypothetical protein
MKGVNGMKSLRIAVGLCALLMFAVSAAHSAELTPVDNGEDFSSGSASASFEDSPAEILDKEPEYKSEKPMYGSFVLGNAKDRCLTIVLDESGGTGSGYDTLFVDANNNNDLTDDPAVEVKSEKSGRNIELEVDAIPVTIKYHDGTERQIATRFSFDAYFWDYGGRSEANWSAYAYPTQHLEGRVPRGERGEMLIAICDDDGEVVEGNGCFDDYGADYIHLDLNGDGAFDSDEEFRLSKALLIDGKLWQLQIDSAGRNAVLEPYAGESGRIAFNMGLAEGAVMDKGNVEMFSNSGYAFAADLAEGGEVTAPPARYRVSQAELSLCDAQEAIWSAEFECPRPIHIAPGETANMSLGGPVTIEPVTAGKLTVGGRMTVSHLIKGIGGEQYISIQKEGVERTPPTVTILDSEGIDVASGKMEYG